MPFAVPGVIVFTVTSSSLFSSGFYLNCEIGQPSITSVEGYHRGKGCRAPGSYQAKWQRRINSYSGSGSTSQPSQTSFSFPSMFSFLFHFLLYFSFFSFFFVFCFLIFEFENKYLNRIFLIHEYFPNSCIFLKFMNKLLNHRSF